MLDWNATDYGKDPVAEGDYASIMPLVINYFTPDAVAVISKSLSQVSILW